MIKRLILCGAGSSGKDYLKHYLNHHGFKLSVSHTTRDPRIGEIEGLTYYYITDDVFLSMIDNNEFREWNKFADKWYYGTTLTQFVNADLFIMTPSGISALTIEERAESLVIYLCIDETTRLNRLYARNDKDSPSRRILTDRVDFDNFSDYDWKIVDPNFDLDNVYERIQHVYARDLVDKKMSQ